MATASDYPLPSLPWQADRPDEFFAELHSLRLYRRGDIAAYAILTLSRRRATDRWHWAILPVIMSGPARRSLEQGYLSRDTCESELISAVTYWLGAPPSAFLPPREGASDGGKEAGCA